jgi:hypothetical protein
MHSEKSYFGTKNGSLAICHIGLVTIEQCEPAQWLVHGRSTVNWHRGIQRSVVRFLWSGAVKPSEMYRRMKVQYGDSCLS